MSRTPVHDVHALGGLVSPLQFVPTKPRPTQLEFVRNAANASANASLGLDIAPDMSLSSSPCAHS